MNKLTRPGVTIRLVAIIFLALLLLSCNKQPGYSAIADQRLRDAVNIHPGSYFLYQDSSTKIEDSFWVGRYVNQDWFDRNANENYEQVQYTIGDSANGFTIAVGAPYGMNNVVGGGGTYGGIHYYQTIFLKLPFPTNTIEKGGAGEVRYLAHYERLNIHGQEFTDVYEVETITEGHSFHSFYSMNSGLVKFITADGVHDLIRFNIVR